MKAKDKKQLGSMDEAELTKTLVETEKKLAGVVGSRYSKQSVNVREVKNLRYKIAVLRTFIRQKELQHG